MSAPEVGVVEVSVTSEGLDPDDDGYIVILNGSDLRSVASPDGNAAFDRVRAGEYRIVLASLAPNCTADADQRTVTVRSLETTAVRFQVTCVATKANLLFSVATAGVIDPDGYEIEIDGNEVGRFRVPANGTTQIRYPFGSAVIRVIDVAQHCAVEGGTSRRAILGPDADVAIALRVHCTNQPTISLGQRVGVVSSSDSYCDPDPMSDAPDPCVRYEVNIPTRGTFVVRVTWTGDRWMVLRLGGDDRRYYAPNGIVGTLHVDEPGVVRFSIGMHDWKRGDSQPFSVSLELIQ